MNDRNSRLQQIETQYLVLGALDGDEAAVESLVNLWSPKLYSYCRRFHRNAEDCEDLVQDIWVTAMKSLTKLNDPARFPAWIFRIAHGKSVDRLRKQVRENEKQEELKHEPPETAAPPTQQKTLEIEEESNALLKLIEDLKPEFKTVIYFFYQEELSIQEIATILDIPKNTVKSRLFHARKQLEEKLKG